MLFERREMNKVLALPKRRHLPRHFFRGVWRGGADDLTQFLQYRLNLLGLLGNIPVNGFNFPAVVVLVRVIKFSLAFRALPHYRLTIFALIRS
jgi:hypothetical protein